MGDCLYGSCGRAREIITTDYERIADLERKLAEARKELSYHADEWICAKVAFELGESRSMRAKENAERAAQWYKDSQPEK